MKQGISGFAAVVMLLLGAGSLTAAANAVWPEKGSEISAWVLKNYLGPAAVATSVPAIPETSPEPVMVRVVEEAWDELRRQETPLQEETVERPAVPGELEIRNETAYGVELSALPTLPTAKEITVLIVHTHGSEGYADTAENNYRTTEEARSVLAVGDAIEESLEAQGVSVLHDRTICDRPEFNNAYNRSREVIESWMAKEDIFLVLDVHRDAVADQNGNQMAMRTSVNGTEHAKLMLVVGTDDGGLYHPEWHQNLSLAAVLQSDMEVAYPGIMRPVNLRSERFNQDLGRLSLLVEVGASGNTLEEAVASGTCFGTVLGTVLNSCKET